MNLHIFIMTEYMHNLILFLCHSGYWSWCSERNGEGMVLGIYFVWHKGADSTDPPEDVGIIKICTALQDLGDLANGCAVLLGLIYSWAIPRTCNTHSNSLESVDGIGWEQALKVQVLNNKLHDSRWLLGKEINWISLNLGAMLDKERKNGDRKSVV